MTSVIIPLIMFSSCEFQSYEDYGIQPYDGSLAFTRVTSNAGWNNRFDHASVAYKDKIWIFGGYNPGEIRGDTYYEDVWSSTDGENWQMVTGSAPWKGRRGHEVVVFDDGSGEAMFLIGGFSADDSTGYRQYCNDVWKSSDGENWTPILERTYPLLQSTDTLFPRMDFAAVVARHADQDYIYVIGGRTQLEDHDGTYANEYFNDVWRSANGIEWEKLENDDYGMRAGHAAAVDPETGMIYIQGGRSGIIFDTDDNASVPVEQYRHLWSSPDGINWSPHYDSAVNESYLQRMEHEMLFFDHALWVFPGATVSNMHYHFATDQYLPTWRVEADSIWTVDSEGSDLRGRHGYSAVMLRDRIWFTGGFTSNRGQENDVWTAEIF